MTRRMKPESQGGDAAFRKGKSLYIFASWSYSARSVFYMFSRRSLMVGGLVTAAASSLARVATAQSGRPMLVFVGHEL